MTNNEHQTHRGNIDAKNEEDASSSINRGGGYERNSNYDACPKYQQMKFV